MPSQSHPPQLTSDERRRRLAGLLATGLVHVLILTTPRPMRFFGWVVALATLAGMLMPFVSDAALGAQMARSDVIITTAQVPGRPAPTLVPAEAVAAMKPGSVVVDLAAETGGNCALTRPGETVLTDDGVKVLGPLNLPSEMPEHASSLYARNVLALLELGFDFDDEVIRGACVVRDGAVV